MNACIIGIALLAGCGGQAPLTPQLGSTWNEVKTGGETVCARGGPYSFFVYPGKQNKLVVDFIGGGACWTQSSCGFAGSLFADSIDSLRQYVANGYPGVYNHATAQNPFNDYYHVIVPYCTGDVHWGNSVVTYGTGRNAFTIRHKGAVNARAVLEWVYANFPSPEEILVTGCSAGAYGSILWSAFIKQHYPNAVVRQLGDSGAGVVTPTFFVDGFPNWNATAAAPSFIPSLDPTKNDWKTLGLPDMYARIAAFYPTMDLAQFNSAYDATQTFFYTAMGGAKTDWAPMMKASIAHIHSTTPNFYSYIAAGTQHCVLPNNDYATMTANPTSGAKFLDWLNGYLAGKPTNAACTDCGTPPM